MQPLAGARYIFHAGLGRPGPSININKSTDFYNAAQSGAKTSNLIHQINYLKKILVQLLKNR